jgi:hypothetical protein
MLRRLSRADMVLCTDGTDVADYRDIDPKATGLALTRRIAMRFGGDRERALRDAANRVGRSVGLSAIGSRLVSCRLVPVAALIPDLARWPAPDRRALLRLVRAKEGPGERRYALLLQRHPRFNEFLRRLSDAQRAAQR